MTHQYYISLYSFFVFAFYLFLEVVSFIPVGRVAHSSILVETKLYFFGGSDGGSTNEVFYLDVSQPFNIAALPWNDLTASKGMPIKNAFGTVSLSETNNEQNIYLFGGITRDLTTNINSFKSLVYKFNLKSEKWEIPTAKGKEPERRRQISAISDNSGKIYIFGGISEGSPTISSFNDMVVFNVIESSWSTSIQSNAPTIRSSYSAILLSSGVIVYIGGYGGGQVVDISQINLYDTNSLTWSVKTAKLLDQVESRKGHSAVLAPNGRIIIYGGSKVITGIFDAKVTPDLAVLNTETFEWTIPSVSSNVGIVPSLTVHTANLVGNYMIVAFGNITQPNALPLALKNNNIYMMDVRSYTWVNAFEPSSSNTSTQTSKPHIPISPTTSTETTNTLESQQDVNKQLTTLGVVVGTVSGIVGTAVFMLAGFFGYKWYQRHQGGKQDKIMRIHGNIT